MSIKAMNIICFLVSITILKAEDLKSFNILAIDGGGIRGIIPA